MVWIELSVYAAEEIFELILAKLTALGIDEVTITQSGEAALQNLGDSRINWDYVDEEELNASRGDPRISAMIPHDRAGMFLLKRVRKSMEELKATDFSDLGIEIGDITVTHRLVKDDGWTENWKKYYRPTEIGKRLLIKPAWEDDISAEDYPAAEGRLILELDPGMAFGTGSHETTRLCLAALEDYGRSGGVLDIGCGSGILSIAACLLGADFAVAVDIDPLAVKTAVSNAALNGFVEPIYTAFRGDILSDREIADRITRRSPEGYGVVLSNIVADVVIGLAPAVKQFLSAGGVWIASGIITARLGEVLDAAAGAGYSVIEVREENDWRAVIMTL